MDGCLTQNNWDPLKIPMVAPSLNGLTKLLLGPDIPSGTSIPAYAHAFYQMRWWHTVSQTGPLAWNKSCFRLVILLICHEFQDVTKWHVSSWNASMHCYPMYFPRYCSFRWPYFIVQYTPIRHGISLLLSYTSERKIHLHASSNNPPGIHLYKSPSPL